MKVIILLLFIGLTFTHCLAQTDTTCVSVKVQAINSKSKKELVDYRIIINGKTGYSKEFTVKNGKELIICLKPSLYDLSVVKNWFLGITKKRIEIKANAAPLELTFELDSNPPANCFPFPDITFERNNFKLAENFRDSLNGRTKTFKDNPNLVFELMGYSDSRGSAKSNIKRSEHYAKVVKEFFVSSGIEPDRIVVKGYGEKELRNKCKDGVKCTPAEHNVNNRVNFKLPGFDYKSKP